MIAGTAYMAGPILYTELGMFKLAKNILAGNHYSINVYWGVILILLAIMCISQGIKSNNTIYYFIAIALILSFFSATSAVMKLKGVANADESGFESNGSMFAVYFEIFSKDCYSKTGQYLKYLVFVFMLSWWFILVISLAAGNQTSFVINMIIFLGIATLQLNAISYFNKGTAAAS
jgi:hypothetical protein